MRIAVDTKRPAVFLDRDGTLIEDVGYLASLTRLQLFPWTIDVIRALNRAALPVVVVTNQSGVARQYFAEAFVQETHRAIDARLAAGGAHVDAYYYCPHHPDGKLPEYAVACDCRKPRSGLIDRAARDLNLEPSASFVVGDSWGDVGLASAVGARAVLIRTGTGGIAQQARSGLTAAAVVDNLAAAASWILMRC